LFFMTFANDSISGGERGHMSRNCPEEQGSGERMCYKCKQPGHIQTECPAA